MRIDVLRIPFFGAAEHLVEVKNKPCNHYNYRADMVETAGLEPAASCLSSRRSNQLSYASAQEIS